MEDTATPTVERETEIPGPRAALAETRSDPERRDAALLQQQDELKASRLELVNARGETVQFQGLLRRADEAVAHARAELEAAAVRNAEIPQLHAMIVALQAETSALRGSIDVLHASASWRMSAPIRIAGRLARGLRKAVSGLPRAPLAPPPGASATPGDPNGGVIFQGAPLVEQPSGEEGIMTLDALYLLSRSL